MIDQVIWARAIVPFLVYDWSYILTFVFYFLQSMFVGWSLEPITERPCGAYFYCRLFFSLFSFPKTKIIVYLCRGNKCGARATGFRLFNL